MPILNSLSARDFPGIHMIDSGARTCGGVKNLGTGLLHPFCRCFIYGLLLASLSLISVVSWADSEVEKSYALGVFPHLPPRELEKVYAPIAAALGKALGRRVEFRSNSTYERFMENLDQESYDIIFTQPFDYIKAADQYGYIPLATRDEPLSALVVVQQGSQIKSLKDLRGKRVAMPPSVAAVSYLFKAFLEKNHLKPGKDVTLSYHRSHVSCLQQVIIGSADACATAAPAYRYFSHKMNVKLNTIAQTPSIPHTLFAVHPRITAEERKKLLAVILSWKSTEEGQILLKRGKLTPFIEVKDSDYDIVRELSRHMKKAQVSHLKHAK